MFWIGRHADTDSDPVPDGNPVEETRRFGLDEDPDPLGHLQGIGESSLRQQGDKLFAAVAEEPVGIAQQLFEQGRQGLQHHIAGRVPVGIVERLEIVDIEGPGVRFVSAWPSG